MARAFRGEAMRFSKCSTLRRIRRLDTDLDSWLKKNSARESPGKLPGGLVASGDEQASCGLPRGELR
jgi:hypothetical protein